MPRPDVSQSRTQTLPNYALNEMLHRRVGKLGAEIIDFVRKASKQRLGMCIATNRHIADKLYCEPKTVANELTRLVKSGHLIRTKDRDGRRVLVVSVTGPGTVRPVPQNRERSTPPDSDESPESGTVMSQTRETSSFEHHHQSLQIPAGGESSLAPKIRYLRNTNTVSSPFGPADDVKDLSHQTKPRREILLPDYDQPHQIAQERQTPPREGDTPRCASKPARSEIRRFEKVGNGGKNWRDSTDRSVPPLRDHAMNARTIDMTPSASPAKASSTTLGYVKTLRDAIVKRTSFRCPYNSAAWAAHMERLLRDLNGDKARLERVLAWYAPRIGKPFVSIALSAQAFRAKFVALELQMIREVGEPTPELSEADQKVVATVTRMVEDMNWPVATNGQIRDVVTRSVAALRAFGGWAKQQKFGTAEDRGTYVRYSDPRDEAYQRVCGFMFGAIEHYLKNWFAAAWKRVRNWAEWNGDLTKFVWSPTHQAAAASVAQEVSSEYVQQGWLGLVAAYAEATGRGAMCK